MPEQHCGLQALPISWLLDNKRVYRLSTRPTISDVQKFTSAKGSKFRVIHVSNIGSTGQSCLIMFPMFQWQRNEVPSLIFQTNQVIVLVIYFYTYIHIYILLYIYIVIYIYYIIIHVCVYNCIHIFIDPMKSHSTSSFIFCCCWYWEIITSPPRLAIQRRCRFHRSLILSARYFQGPLGVGDGPPISMAIQIEPI